MSVINTKIVKKSQGVTKLFNKLQNILRMHFENTANYCIKQKPPSSPKDTRSRPVQIKPVIYLMFSPPSLNCKITAYLQNQSRTFLHVLSPFIGNTFDNFVLRRWVSIDGLCWSASIFLQLIRICGFTAIDSVLLVVCSQAQLCLHVFLIGYIGYVLQCLKITRNSNFLKSYLNSLMTKQVSRPIIPTEIRDDGDKRIQFLCKL